MLYFDYVCDCCDSRRENHIVNSSSEIVRCGNCEAVMRKLFSSFGLSVVAGKAGNYKNGYSSS